MKYSLSPGFFNFPSPTHKEPVEEKPSVNRKEMLKNSIGRHNI